MAERHGTAQLGAEKAEGYLINVYKYLMKGVKKAVRLFSVVSSEWKRNNGYKLKYKQFHFKIFHSKVVKHLNRLPREAVKSPSLDLQNLTEHGTEQPALADLLLSRRVWLNNLQRGFPNSDIVWFCKQFTLAVLFFSGNATLLWTTTLIKKVILLKTQFHTFNDLYKNAPLHLPA